MVYRSESERTSVKTSLVLGKRQNMAPPDLTLLFSGEVAEWDSYLTQQFENSCDPTPTIIEHEQIEEISFPICTSQSRHFTDARVVLVILSPSFLDFLDRHADEGFQIGKLLKPSRTVAMLCGVQPSDVSSFHKAALVTYDDWPHIVARDKDVNMVRSVVDTVQDLLTRSKENERIHKPKFKLIPRKVNEGNGKVFVILNKPLEDTKKVKITLEGHGVKEVPVKRRNPYTLQFVVPDICMQVLSVLNVHVRCNDDLLGVSQLKCESRMGELYNLLSSINSPYEFICHTLGLATLHEVDEHMVATFRKNLPPSGFSLLHVEEKCEKKKSKEEFPTLLHFAARYGLCNLCKELLRCPGSQTACLLKNSRGLTPAQMATHAGHNDIANVLESFQKSVTAGEKTKSTQVAQPSTVVYEQMQVESHDENYDIPPTNPARVILPPTPTSEEEEAVLGKECEYLKMMGTSPRDPETFEPHKKLILGFDHKRDESEEVLLSSLSGDRPPSPQRISQGDKAKLALLESQAKLIEIMEAYKKGASLIEVEKLHNEWKAMYQVSDAEAKSTLEGLRNMYARAQKAKISKKQSSSFSELRQFFGSKLRRKDSVGSKGSCSRKNSKELNCIEKLCLEVEGLRPVSTLSITSNTSSSSGSSFDRLSSVSGGSDSGNHSDYGEETNRLREAGKFESRVSHPVGLNGNLLTSHPSSIPLSLNSKPPAPPPRPIKPPSFINKYENRIYSNSLDNTAYSMPHKHSASLSTPPGKSLDYVMPDSTLDSGSSLATKKSTISKSADDLLIVPGGDCKTSDPCDLYDTPPPVGSLFLKQQIMNLGSDMPKVPTSPIHNCGLSFSNAAKNETYGMDYDLVPPPLPLSVPPRRPSFSKFERSSSLSNYDIPRFAPSNPTSKEILEANYDFPRLDQNSLCSCLLKPRKDSLPPCCCSASSYDVPLSPRKYSLPNTPLSDAPSGKNLPSYCNMNFCRNSCSSDDQCDSIPDEPPPPPPQELSDEEEHYKLVGIPVPIPGANLANITSKC